MLLLLSALLVTAAAVTPTINQVDIKFPQPCWNDKATIPTFLHHGSPMYLSSEFVPRCDDHGMYESVQCHGVECWCVTPCGEEIEDTRTTDWPVCETHQLPCRDLERSSGHTPSCDKHGYFLAQQCDGDECWCVTKCGQEITGSRTQGNPRCSQFFKREKTQTRQSKPNVCPDGDSPKRCPREDICKHLTCPGFPDALCKPNKCEGCRPEFFDSKGKKITCSDEKLGMCPAFFEVDTSEHCEPECSSDSDCSGSDKCCFSGCTTQCQHVTSDKYGSCPLESSFEDKSCEVRCNSDWDCADSEKCCSNGCGQVCVSPAIPTKSQCPAMWQISEEICNDVSLMCESDSDCIDDDISCCSTKCGKRCTSITTTVLPPCEEERTTIPTTTFGGVSLPVLGHWYPTCNSSGFHTPKQCHPTSGLCWCVDACGRPIDGTHTYEELECRPRNAPCHEAKSNLLRPGLRPLLGAFKPRCMEDGFFETKQCQGSMCWCVDKCGHEVPNTRGHLKDVTCDQCPDNQRAFHCPKNPCDDVTCPDYPEARCFPSICGGCKAEFFIEQGKKVQCNVMKNNTCPLMEDMPQTCETECAHDGECPGTHKCCSNGCASVCVSPITEERPGSCPAITFGDIGSCSTTCYSDSDCSGVSKCCFNGCGKTCVHPEPVVHEGECPVQWEKTCTTEENQCEVDNDCIGSQRCCNSGCGLRCIYPTQTRTIKSDIESITVNAIFTATITREMTSGQCPHPDNLQCNHLSECLQDEDCNDGSICCSNGCGFTCTPPWTMEKYGQCPMTSAAFDKIGCSLECDGGMCNHQCSDDGDCPGFSKCCMDGCTRVCVNPWMFVRDGQCPMWTQEDIQECSSSSECSSDTDCTSEKKCCNTPCGGTVCSKPVTESLDTCTFQGLTHHHGDMWSPDVCTVCKCVTGVTRCTPLHCDAIPAGCSPVHVDGQCCPSIQCETSAEADWCEDERMVRHMHGERWSLDSCSYCECIHGQITCSQYTCTSDVMRNTTGCTVKHVPGRCCPEVVCQDRCIDHYGHLRYENDMWYVDACTMCSCVNGKTECTEERSSCSVPEELHPDCTLEKVPGQCCPNVNCPVEGRKMSCSLEDREVGHMSTWRPNSCTMCECRDGQDFCANIDCPAFSNPLFSDCIKVYVDGKCCPETICNKAEVCAWEGQTFFEGEMWQPETCSTCQCIGGTTRCTQTTCPVTPPSCQAVPVNGKCCPDIVCQPHHHSPVCKDTEVMHREGDSWHLSDCQVCTCRNGQTSCSTMDCPVTVAAPGCHLVQVPGRCCPMQICRHQADSSCTVEETELTYQHGATWQEDSCTTCACVKGVISCMKQTCAVPREGCVVEEVEGQCCPKVNCLKEKLGSCPIPLFDFLYESDDCVDECAEDTDCMGPSKCCYNGCSLTCAKPWIDSCVDSNGRQRSSGDVWQQDSCTVCSCVNNQSVCTPQECPRAPNGCTTRHVEGQCCPTIICEEQENKATCLVEGVTYTHGSSWMSDSCTMCTCMFGRSDCNRMECPAMQKTGCRSVYIPGQCCPETFCQEAGSCIVEGVMYLDGESFHTDACTTCLCRKGQTYCQVQSCPAIPEGCQPITTETTDHPQCCPNITCPLQSAPTCLYRGIDYRSGEQWMSDACTMCTCEDQQVTCNTTSCPTMTFAPGCRAVRVPGQCCPDINCRDVHSCLEGGVKFLNGEQWQNDSCTSCRCEHGRTICSSTSCAPAPTGCKLGKHMPGQCCPNVVCPTQSGPTCVDTIDMEETQFVHGESWQRNPCTTCTCMNGRVRCHTQSCPMTLENGCRAVHVQGQCCPNVVCNEGKLGQCPIVTPTLTEEMSMMDSCVTDSDCAGTSKCCHNGYAFTCIRPWILEKPGVCPAMTPYTSSATVCNMECSTDMDCVESHKCCGDGCIKTCVPAVMEVQQTFTRQLAGSKSGRCPNLMQKYWTPLMCISECSDDMDCDGEDKCCSTGCGQVCFSPVEDMTVTDTCEPLTCRMSCKYGYATDSQGCDICLCKKPVSECDKLDTCKMYCPYGYATDTEGCDICRCKAPVMQICKTFTCPLTCPNGLATDKFGCEICQCKTPIEECTPLDCTMECPYGLATDMNGCDICQCKRLVTVSCEAVSCAKQCIYGFSTDTNGCQICECKKPENLCESVSCDIECQHGFATDSEGCEICRCQLPISHQCQSLTCSLECEDGFATDMYGCEICRCKKSVSDCEVPSCEFECDYGFATDNTGCQICKCKLPTEYICKENVCSKDCKFGFATDSYGCDVCKCRKPDFECERMDCGLFCPYGFATNKEGCEMCQCRKALKTTCKPIACTEHCEFGYMTDSYGCDMCLCKKKPSECESFDGCSLDCPFGWATDSNGCDICVCKPPVAIQCEPVKCRMMCVHGWATDEYGCETCKCRVPPTESLCEDMDCSINCPFGFATDEQGCQVCKCMLPTPCPALGMERCDLTCKHGFMTDESGCQICQCQERPSRCPALEDCRLSCPWGMSTNEEGCNICQCRRPSVCTPLTEQTCPLTCVEGYATNTFGCEICKCRPSAEVCKTDVSLCKEYCPYGFMTNKDGCEICQCRLPTTIQITSVCMKWQCHKFCPHGYLTDSSGCQTCTCAELPEQVCPHIKYGTSGRCVDECSHDGMCAPNQLCCSNGCARTCMESVSAHCVDEMGESHTQGSTWERDSCTVCSCMNGDITCHTSKCMPVPHGCLPVHTPGHCCPAFDCPIKERLCTKEGKHWEEDVCTNCTCQSGKAICIAQACPQVPSGCKPIFSDTECCPRFECHDSCMTQSGSMIPHGETYNVDKCTSCICRKGKSICTPTVCPMPRPDCDVVHVEGACCPTVVCTHEAKKRPCHFALKKIPSLMLMGKTVPMTGVFVPSCDINGYYNATQCHGSTGYCWCVDRFGQETPGSRVHHSTPICKPSTCVHNGHMYREGDQWQRDTCTTCTCMGGQAMCHSDTCAPTPDGCTPIIAEGQCCPQFVCEEKCIDIVGKEWSIGESWMVEHCTHCTCARGDIKCRVEQCPRTEAESGCQVIPSEGQCCASKVMCDDECESSHVAHCLKNPCLTATCPGFPDATCKPSYCGSCKALWVDRFDQEVVCQTTGPCDATVTKRTNWNTMWNPRCAVNGFYTPKQCDSEGSCWCVGRDGELMPGTRKEDGSTVDCIDEPPCWEEQQNIQTLVSQGHDITRDPQCDTRGYYKSHQCDPVTNKCWCVEKDGHVVPGSETTTHQKLSCSKPCFGQKPQKETCTEYGSCSGNNFCHILPGKSQGYCCKPRA
ncbi:KCP [Branchiostoma lanceolatum]|uniref:KCP protein n=2 Tax=Branchiostoma lanceolatum TaxID=7740 RepID=A0A8J9Z321_BRALA|nr:KCP [Branchiostoma lanceolatum]